MPAAIQTADVVRILDLTAEALQAARDLCGISAAHREACVCVRDVRLETAEALLADALARLDAEGSELLVA